MKKRFVQYAVAVCMVLVVAFGVCNVQAKEKKLSKSKSKQMVKECHVLDNAIAFCSYYEMKTGETVKWDFSKKKYRAKVIKYYPGYKNYGTGDTEEEGAALSKNLFGKRTELSQSEFVVGDWGASWPENKKFQCYKTGSGKYKVTSVLYTVSDEFGTKKEGKVTYYLKKSSNSSYGYHITKITYKKVGK